jgi:hypothetical protein
LGGFLVYQHLSPESKSSAATLSAEGAVDEGLEVAVFRFTLGIPGFDDAYLPRVVGALGLGLLAVNHVLGAQPPSTGQVPTPNRVV